MAVAQHAPAHDPKPQFDLIEPGAVGGRVMEDESPPVTAIPLRYEAPLVRVLVRIEIVEHDVNALLPIDGGHEVHEGQEVLPRAPRRTAPDHPAGRDVEAAEEARDHYIANGYDAKIISPPAIFKGFNEALAYGVL